MLRSNLIEAAIGTVTGGSPDTFTLSDVSGSPNFDDVFGTSGSILVTYIALQYSDSTRTVITQAQWGKGTLNLATLVLTQTAIQGTWLASGPTYDNTSPAELTFTASSTTTRVLCSPLADDVLAGCPFFDDAGSTAATCANVGQEFDFSGLTMQADRIYYTPFLWMGGWQINSAGVLLYTASASNSVRVGLYDIGDDGKPQNLIADFGTIGVSTPTGYKMNSSASFVKPSGAPLWLPPGWYYAAVVSNSTPEIAGSNWWTQGGPLGGGGRTTRGLGTDSFTFGALNADAASNGSGTTFFNLASNAPAPLIWFAP